MMTRSDPADSLVFECDFEEPPEKVWRALTEPRLLEAWLTAPAHPKTDAQIEARTEAQSDARPHAQTGVAEEQGASSHPQPRDFELLAAEPHRLLRYRWRDRDSRVGDSDRCEVHSVVTFELAPGEKGGTHLRLTHGEFESRMVSAAPVMAVARARPITSARRRTRILSRVQQTSWRRAA